MLKYLRKHIIKHWDHINELRTRITSKVGISKYARGTMKQGLSGEMQSHLEEWWKAWYQSKT